MPDPTYPVDYSDQDLRTELRDLSARIAAYSNAKLLDDLIKDAVRFNLGYSELQNRQVKTYSTWALRIGVASLLVALAAFVLGYAQARASARAADRQVQTVEIFTRRLLSADSLRSEVATLRRVVDSLVRTYGKHPSRPRVQTR